MLSGLAPDDELDALTAWVVYDEALLGEPSITAGPILPDPRHGPLDYLPFEDAGWAEVTFLTFGDEPADRIHDNGLFFSFDVTALAPGQGEFSFDLVDATAPNPQDLLDPLPVAVQSGAPLPFEVVPEPSSGPILAVMAAFIAAGCVAARRRRRYDMGARQYALQSIRNPEQQDKNK